MKTTTLIAFTTILLACMNTVFAQVYDCSVLDSPSSGKLAIDYPDKFEELIQKCANSKNQVWKSDSKEIVVNNKPTQNQNKTKEDSNQNQASDNRDGCDFLVYKKYPQLKHSFGADYCHEGKRYTCMSSGSSRKTYHWKIVESCAFLPSPETKEYNLTHLEDVRSNFFDESED